MESLNVAFWRQAKSVQNLGDFLNEILLSAVGVRCNFIDPSNHDKSGLSGRYFLGVGSVLDRRWLGQIGRPVDVWGSGAYDASAKSAISISDVNILAVRGPRTIKLLGLHSDTPQGDPALLTPCVFPVKSKKINSRIIYVPHFHNCRTATSCMHKAISIGALEFVSIAVERNQWAHQVYSIATASFVLTNSLHGAILAHAYKIPWAVVLHQEDNLDKPGKWKDWFEYIGIPYQNAICKTSDDAAQWWDKYGRHANRPSLDGLIAVFPMPDIRPKLAQRHEYLENLLI